mgnify:CR=1 FL=1
MAISVCALIKFKDKPLKIKKDHRFMAIIPAHNEEAVVGNLIESLKNQTTHFQSTKMQKNFLKKSRKTA